MKHLFIRSCVLLIVVVATACSADEPPAAVGNGLYEYKAGSRDGIGKFYLGREISHVMGHLGAGWLERPERERQERTDLLIESLPIMPGDTVADIGAGTGFFTFPIAKRNPNGLVYAVDIQPEMLALVNERKTSLQLSNVEAVLGTETSPGLPAGTVDLAFIVDAYHEFSYPREMGEALVNALRPGGKLVLVEYRAEDASVPIKTLHKMSEEQARRQMHALGLRRVTTDDSFTPPLVPLFATPASVAGAR